MPPSLTSLARISELHVRVRAAAARLGVEPARAAGELDALVARARAGASADRTALVACALALANDDQLAATLLAAATGLPRATCMLRDAPAHRAVRKKGRLREVCVPESFSPSTVVGRSLVHRLLALHRFDEGRRWVDDWEGEPAHPADDVYPVDDPAYRGHFVLDDTVEAAPPRLFAADAARLPYLRDVVRGVLPRDVLLHPSPRMVRKLLACVSLRDVLVIASRRPSSAAIAREITSAIAWSARLPVRAALAGNPFTPTGLVLRFLPTLPERLVAEIARGPAHPLVREAARVLGRGASDASSAAAF